MRIVYPQSTVLGAARITEQAPWSQGTIRPQPASRKEKLIEAGIALIELFDEGMARANLARVRSGWSAVIKRRQEHGARCYYVPTPQAGERTLVLFIALPLFDGDVFGGAYIRPGTAQSALYVIPSIDAESPRWLTQVSRTEVNASIVDDLFQATFYDDAVAARRLAPLYGSDDLFVTPWS